MAEPGPRLARVQRLVQAARDLVNDAPLRERLRETTGLSAPNIELCLTRSLETRPSPEDLAELLARTPESPRAHVLLSGNVFVAALRAIAVAVASSESVKVRASRRDPALAEALHASASELFDLDTHLEPRPGDHFWSYGSDETLAEVRAGLPSGVWFHAHGTGFGAVVVQPSLFGHADARALALDTALFDQRGCLSPRVVCSHGSLAQARVVAEAVASALAELELELPPGSRSGVELAELRRQRDAAAYAYELFAAGSGWVSVSEQLVLPPAVRSLHVMATPDPIAALRPFSAHLTNVACNAPQLSAALRVVFPGARHPALGHMQCPPLDGPVDRRHGSQGERV